MFFKISEHWIKTPLGLAACFCLRYSTDMAAKMITIDGILSGGTGRAAGRNSRVGNSATFDNLSAEKWATAEYLGTRDFD
jgi:hypothetical protein